MTPHERILRALENIEASLENDPESAEFYKIREQMKALKVLAEATMRI